MKRCITLVLALALLAPPASAAWRIVVEPQGRSVPARVVVRDGIPYIHLADVARALGGSRHWNPANRKAALIADDRRFVMSPGNSFVAVADRIVNMRRPALFEGGEFWVPPGFLDEAVGPALHLETVVDLEVERVTLRDLGPVVGDVVIEERSGSTVVTIGLSDWADIHVESHSSGAIDLFVQRAALADTVELVSSQGYVARVSARERQGGTSLMIETARGATTYRVERLDHPRRLEVIVEARAGSVPAPALREPKELLARPSDPFSTSEGVEVVMIDPGYGGHETGTVGRGGVLAKDVTLEIAQDLGAALQRRGFYVFMTRSSDSYVPLERRCELANLADADVFIAIRCDAWISAAAAGFQVQHYEAPREAPLPVALPRRGGLRYDHPSVLTRTEEALLWRNAQEQYVDESRVLARLVRGELRSALPSADRGVRTIAHTALEGCGMPAIVVSLGYLTSGGDSGRMQDEAFRQDAAGAIASALTAYRSGWKERNP